MTTNSLKPTLYRLAGATLLAFVGACAPTEDAETSDVDAMSDTSAATADVAMALPDTTASSLWSYLQSIDYENAWTRWPGTDAFYEGNDPHGMLLTTYVNDSGHTALTAMLATMPHETVVVKENYMPDSTLAAVTAMYKVDGYDPEHSDWFWAKFTPDGSVEVAGRIESCQTCHQRGPDFIRTEGFGEDAMGSR